jgi:hypothetical protein
MRSASSASGNQSWQATEGHRARITRQPQGAEPPTSVRPGRCAREPIAWSGELLDSYRSAHRPGRPELTHWLVSTKRSPGGAGRRVRAVTIGAKSRARGDMSPAQGFGGGDQSPCATTPACDGLPSEPHTRASRTTSPPYSRSPRARTASSAAGHAGADPGRCPAAAGLDAPHPGFWHFAGHVGDCKLAAASDNRNRECAARASPSSSRKDRTCYESPPMGSPRPNHPRASREAPLTQASRTACETLTAPASGAWTWATT